VVRDERSRGVHTGAGETQQCERTVDEALAALYREGNELFSL
jgi:hypothetical protein